MNRKLNLQEATMLALSNQLDDGNVYEDVEGVIDDVLVVTDPDVTPEQYDEIIERAQEIVEDTPEGEIPYDEDFLGQYVLTCPICGNDFLCDHILENGTACPICEDTPEAFLVKGQLQQEDRAAAEVGVMSEEESELDDLSDELGIENAEESEEESGEEAWNKQLASKEISQGNKLIETKLEENFEEVDDIDIDTKDTNKNNENNKIFIVIDSYGNYAKGLIIDDNNKQYKRVKGSELPYGKYKKLSLNDFNQKIQELQEDGYENK